MIINNWHKYFNKQFAIIFLMGLSSGLPLALTGGTLQAWMKSENVDLGSIGLFAMVGLPYSLKFLWSPLVDQLRLPFLSQLGQRRSWLLLAQLLLCGCLLAMSVISPQALMLFVLFTFLAAFAGATQDIVVDAYRIEIAPAEVQGALAATYTLGYRFALLASGALALILADHIAWSLIYQLMAALVLVLMLVTYLAKEPERQQHTFTSFGAMMQDGVIGPFKDFFVRYSGMLGVGLLLFMGLFKISDQMLGVMALPFYLDSGFTKTEIGAVSKLFGVWVGIAGAFIGGACVVRFGIERSLFVGMIFGGMSNLLFILLSLYPANLNVFVAVIGGENFAGGFLGTAAVAWLSSLVNKHYTATQYALFSSLVTLPGKLIGGLSGFMVTSIGYVGFFVFSTLSVLPAIILFVWLRRHVSDKQEK